MNKKINEIVKKLNETLKTSFPDFKGAYLYGSYAKNTSHKYSDIDIVALFQNQLNRVKQGQVWRIIGKLEAENNVFIDLHIMTSEELEQNPFYYEEVVQKGIFYDAA